MAYSATAPEKAPLLIMHNRGETGKAGSHCAHSFPGHWSPNFLCVAHREVMGNIIQSLWLGGPGHLRLLVCLAH